MTETTSPGSRTGRKRLVKGLIIVVLVAIAVFGWFAYKNAPVAYHAPVPIMPKPNGYDYFVAAGKALVGKDNIRKAVGKPSDFASMNPAVTRSEKLSLVNKNAKTLSLLREGFRYRFANPSVRSLYTSNKPYYPMRDIAWLHVIQADNRIAAGDYGGAMRSYLDACEMGARLPQGGTLLPAVVGITCEDVGRRDAWGIIDNVPADTARQGALRVSHLLSTQPSTAELMTEEKHYSASGLAEMINEMDYYKLVMNFTYLNDNLHVSDDSTYSHILLLARIYTASKRSILRSWVKFSDQCIEECRKPYPQRVWPKSGEPIVLCLSPMNRDIQCRIEVNRAIDGLLCLSLALRAYKLEHGEYPQALADLTPGYLAKLPNDPFSMRGTFRYRPTKEGYLLYSLGRDCVDDGGKPSRRTAAHSDDCESPSQAIDADAKGDIVAGVNSWIIFDIPSGQ